MHSRLLSVVLVVGCTAPETPDRPDVHTLKDEPLAHLALATTDASAAAELRRRGQRGVDALFAANAKAASPRFAQVVREVSGQHLGEHSRLFWFDNLGAAKAASAASGKPILSLRMLGDLRDARSCANSRLFRVLLYAHPDVSKIMRQRYILHHSSERDVPKLTIDFGDGRKIESTVGGNSIHYVLDARGNIIDALPGLYAAPVFAKQLTAADTLHKHLLPLTGDNWQAALKAHHEQALRQQLPTTSRFIRSNLTIFTRASKRSQTSDVAHNEVERMLLAFSKHYAPIAAGTAPPAAKAVRVATSKLKIERNIVTDMAPWQKQPLPRRAEQIWQLPWQRLMPIKTSDLGAQPIAIAMTMQRDSQEKMIETLRLNLALDSARNQLLLRPQLRMWIANNVHPGFDSFNNAVYSQVFLTPKSDKWLGFVDPTVFRALADDVIDPAARTTLITSANPKVKN